MVDGELFTSFNLRKRTFLPFCVLLLLALIPLKSQADSVAAIARHQADVEKILNATTDVERDRALRDAISFLETKDSRIGTWIRPNESLPQRFGDLLNAFAYSEFSNTAASIRAGADITMEKAEQRLRTTVNRVFRDDGFRLLKGWDHTEVIQPSVTADDIYRMMVNRITDNDRKFPRIRILDEKKETLAGVHILQQTNGNTVSSAEILLKISGSSEFTDATRARAKTTLEESRSALTRGFAGCALRFRKIGGG